MGAAITEIRNHNEYQQILENHPLVIALFTSEFCPGCVGADARFNNIAEKYADRVKSMLLKTENTPRIEGVDGTPTLVVYKDGIEVKNIKGIGNPTPSTDSKIPNEQEVLLAKVFSEYAAGIPTAPVSPAAPPPPPR
ncbi:thioredoxin family protein [Pseudomonas sp. 1152_12]|uniref:thioredoxin family protein n=1 Tax=Pseudomonas sp. 1152_12 TaxID=2604455 RepID=UPI004063EA7A